LSLLNGCCHGKQFWGKIAYPISIIALTFQKWIGGLQWQFKNIPFFV